jgi:hypothetical protein
MMQDQLKKEKHIMKEMNRNEAAKYFGDQYAADI